MRRITVVGIAVIALVLGGATAAHADLRSSPQNQIESILAEHPGGIQTGPNTISWDGGAVILTLADSIDGIAPLAVGSCSTGYYCAYNGVSLSGSKLSFSTCNTTVSLSALPGVVRSLANARSSGYIQGRNSGGTTLATVNANSQLNSAPAGITQLRCVS